MARTSLWVSITRWRVTSMRRGLMAGTWGLNNAATATVNKAKNVR